MKLYPRRALIKNRERELGANEVKSFENLYNTVNIAGSSFHFRD
jgi:hypothetical protein